MFLFSPFFLSLKNQSIHFLKFLKELIDCIYNFDCIEVIKFKDCLLFKENYNKHMHMIRQRLYKCTGNESSSESAVG